MNRLAHFLKFIKPWDLGRLLGAFWAALNFGLHRLARHVTSGRPAKVRQIYKISVLVSTDFLHASHVLSEFSKVAAEHPLVLKQPRPEIIPVEWDDSAGHFELCAWTGDFARRHAIRSELVTGIVQKLPTVGIEIPPHSS